MFIRSLAQAACAPVGFDGGIPVYHARPPLWCLPVRYGAEAWVAFLPLAPRGWLALLGRLYPCSVFGRFDD
jgi:hypothetical protein